MPEREAATWAVALSAGAPLPRLRPELGRRLDRLSRAAHRFHRFAHHPLCEPYRPEVLRFGKRTRLCRGCSYAALGGAAGFALGALLRAPLWLPLVLAMLGTTLGVVALRYRAAKHWTRLVPAAGLAFACLQGLRAESVSGALLATGVLLGVTSLVLAYRRRAPDRTPCASCAERSLEAACSGLRPIVQRERAFRRVAGRIIEASELARPLRPESAINRARARENAG